MGSMTESATFAEEPNLAEAARTWLRIGLLSFGGPAGQIALMQRILVDEKRWISEHKFLHALNYCMLLPGPEAIQLAIYIGWLLHGTRGALTAGLLFLAPGVTALMALSVTYALVGEVAWVEAAFLGLKAAVLAIVIGAVIRLSRRALASWSRYLIAAAAFLALFAFNVPFPLVVMTAAALGFLGGWLQWPAFRVRQDDSPSNEPEAEEGGGAHLRRSFRVLAVWLPLWLAPIGLSIWWLGGSHVFSEILIFFSKLAVVTFGGAYAVLSYMAQQAVEFHGWLSPAEMLDGLGLAETTPGPLILVVQFVGFLAGFREAGLVPLLGGVLGGLLAVWVTFVPSFLFILLGAPYVEKLQNQPTLAAALAAITAAVVGVVLNLAIWFGIHVLFTVVEPVRIGLFALDLPAINSLDLIALVLCLVAFTCQFALKWGILGTLGICMAGSLSLWALGVL